MSKVALVTGASAGIGKELARLFAADGHHLALVARREERLTELATELESAHGVRAHVIPADLSHPDAPARILAALQASALPVEFLVNNAGFGMTGTFVDLDLERTLDLLRVNVSNLVHLTRLLLPEMVARRSGRILNVGSTAGFQPGPFMAVYYASKAFVNSFSEALSFELQGTGVSATLCCPGPTLSEFAAIAGNDKSPLFERAAMSAADVASVAYRGMMRGKSLAIPGIWNKLGLQSLRVAPRAVVRGMTAALNRTSAGGMKSVAEPRSRRLPS